MQAVPSTPVYIDNRPRRTSIVHATMNQLPPSPTHAHGPEDAADAGMANMAATMFARAGDGWDKGKSQLVAYWADIAQSYGWMHADACRQYRWRAGALNVPVIIISTFTGAATATLGSLFSGPEYAGIQPFIAIGLGMFSLLAGVLGTLEQKFKFTQLAERHGRASSDWYNLWRLINACLALSYTERTPFRFFLQNMQTTIDTLTENRPNLPSVSVKRFSRTFGHVVGLRKPHECAHMTPTSPDPLSSSAGMLPLRQLQRLAEETQLELTSAGRAQLRRATSRMEEMRSRRKARPSLSLSAMEDGGWARTLGAGVEALATYAGIGPAVPLDVHTDSGCSGGGDSTGRTNITEPTRTTDEVQTPSKIV